MLNYKDRMLELIGKMEKSVSLILSGREQDVVDELLEIAAQIESNSPGTCNSPSHLNQLENKNAELSELLKKCHSERESISCKLIEYEVNKKKLKDLRGKRVGIIGGHAEDIRRISTMLDTDLGIKSKSTAGESSTPPYLLLKEKYRNFDLLIILTSYAGHALTGSAERLCDEFAIRKIYDSANLLSSIKQKVIEALT